MTPPIMDPTTANPNAPNLVWHPHKVTKADRHALNGHRSCVLWFTGLSGSGKSTLANTLAEKLHQQHIRTYTLDGDNIRQGLNRDLGFSDADRTENIRRIAEVGKLFVDAGVVVTTAFISPFRQDRDYCRSILELGEFVEIYVKCPIDVCESRDVKGLYAKARRGEIQQFTGIDSPYEEPVNPELILETDQAALEACLETVLAYLAQRRIIQI